MAQARVEVRAVVVLGIERKTHRVRPVHVLLPGVKLPLGRARGVDPNLARGVLVPKAARRHMRHQVMAVHHVVKLALERRVNKVGKLRVARARQPKHERLVEALVQDVVVVAGGNERHRRTERVAGDRHTRLLVRRAVLPHFGEDRLRDSKVRRLESVKQLHPFGVRTAKRLGRVYQPEISVVDLRKGTDGLGSFKGHRDPQALGLEDQGALHKVAVTKLVQQLCIAYVLPGALEQAVVLLRHARRLAQQVPVDRDRAGLLLRRGACILHLRTMLGNLQGLVVRQRQDARNKEEQQRPNVHHSTQKGTPCLPHLVSHL